MKHLFLAFALTVLAGCTGCTSNGGELSESQADHIARACIGTTAVIRTVTIAHDEGKVSTATAEKVLNAAERIRPICGSPTPPTLSSLQLAVFDQAIADIATARDELRDSGVIVDSTQPVE